MLKVWNFHIRVGKFVWYPLQTVYAIGAAAGFVACLWLIASLVEIFFKNLTPGAIYSSWNYFAMLR